MPRSKKPRIATTEKLVGDYSNLLSLSQDETLSKGASLWESVKYKTPTDYRINMKSQMDSSGEDNAENKRRYINYDPVGESTIKLIDLCHKLKAKIKKKKLEERMKKATVKPKKEEPAKVSSQIQISQNKPEIKMVLKGCLTREMIEEQRKICIKKILSQTGCNVETQKIEEPLQHLSNAMHLFLMKFVKCLHHHSMSGFSKNNNLLAHLETTINEIGFGGIDGLYEYYYKEFVHRHDFWYKKYLDLLEQCKTLNINLESDDYVINMQNNIEAGDEIVIEKRCTEEEFIFDIYRTNEF